MQTTREKIMKAAYVEFEARGYAQASTNRIVSAAGVSKGTLFNYFGTKEKLYHECVKEAVSITIAETDNLLYKETGFIERMYEIMQFKQTFQVKYPELTQFLSKAYLNRTLPKQYQEKMDVFGQTSIQSLFEGLDLTSFRDDLAHDTMMDLIRWTLDGYSEHMQKLWQYGVIDLEDLGPYYEAFEIHLEAMKKLYYKE